MKMALHDSVKEILKQLPEKERVIIEARYGFREGGPVSINDICNELNIKKEEYKSLERKALIAMRPLMIQKGLNAYIAE
jgi:DNA-directed RNA polymerase sigma subunit (sigma70/sigma32)